MEKGNVLESKQLRLSLNIYFFQWGNSPYWGLGRLVVEVDRSQQLDTHNQ